MAGEGGGGQSAVFRRRLSSALAALSSTVATASSSASSGIGALRQTAVGRFWRPAELARDLDRRPHWAALRAFGRDFESGHSSCNWTKIGRRKHLETWQAALSVCGLVSRHRDLLRHFGLPEEDFDVDYVGLGWSVGRNLGVSQWIFLPTMIVPLHLILISRLLCESPI